MDNQLIIEKNQNSTLILMQRPAKHNALSSSLMEDLRTAVLAAEPSLNLILCSTSDIFCSGLDLDELQERWPDPRRLDEYFQMLHNLYLAVYSHPAPTISIVYKGAYGGGFGLACCSDLILARPETSFVLPGNRFGNLARLARPPLVTKLASVDLEATTPLAFSGQSSFAAGLCDSLSPYPPESNLETFTSTLKSRCETRQRQCSQQKFAQLCGRIKTLVLTNLDLSLPPNQWKEL